MLKKALDAQRAEGRAAVALIDAAGQVVEAPRQAPAAPGTGTLVDVLA